jgi:hypothetical protein
MEMSDTFKQDRGLTHGNYSLRAELAQRLKEQVRSSTNWTEYEMNALSAPQRESIEMICHKMARILEGDPNHLDHWVDIAGYATLIVNGLEGEVNS